MNRKISAVYKITNTITGDFYIGSSKNVYQRWAAHKKPSVWKKCPNNPMYQDMQKYGVESFKFDIIMQLDDEYMLKSTEQELIEYLKPTYNDRNAKGLNDERRKSSYKSHNESKKHKLTQKAYQNRKCIYNNKELTLNALAKKFYLMKIPHYYVEATKYLIKEK